MDLYEFEDEQEGTAMEPLTSAMEDELTDGRDGGDDDQQAGM